MFLGFGFVFNLLFQKCLELHEHHKMKKLKYLLKALPILLDIAALGNQRFSLGVELLAMCRGDLSAVIAWLMS